MEYKIKQYWKPIVSVIFYIAVATVAAKFVPHNSMEDIYDGNILLQIRHDFLQMLLIAPFAFAYCRGGQPRAQEAGITKKFFSAIVCVASALVAVGVALRHACFYTVYAFFYYLLVVACGEELVFRGYLFERLYAESSFCMAVLVSGLLYGLAHGIFSFAVLRASWWEIFSNIGGGIVGTAFYAFLFKQTGTIAVPVLVHWALDFCGYIF